MLAVVPTDQALEEGISPEQLDAVQQRLLAWYAQHGRDLPWRRTRDPYAVLVAEIMLQQTQVDRVIPFWHAWLAAFPSLSELAAASRADVIRAWQGLGYNLRAVRLHEIARQVVAEYAGQLPRSLDGLLRLKGIGRYTAGAVACFAYELPVSMVDTNVQRVLGRVFVGQQDSHGRAGMQSVADTVLPTEHAYAWNQALMDLGATLCRSERPLCLVCPLLGTCRASLNGRAQQAPRRGRSTSEEPFSGSERYFRGRVVDVVRSLAPGESIDLGQLVAQLPAPIASARLERLVRRLASDGLLALDNEQRVRLPD
jgi:A/G-specific adenine glycosylase